jgi:phosphate transport system permease protein
VSIQLSAPPEDQKPPERIEFVTHRPMQDRVFRSVARTAGGLTLAAMAVVFIALVTRSAKAARSYGIVKMVTSQNFQLTAGRYGLRGILLNTVAIAVVAIVLALPVSVGAALFINEYTPRPLRRSVTALIDMLAAVPGVVYGFWGLAFFTPRARLVSLWLTHHLAFIPLFKTVRPLYSGSTFIVGIVVALMVTPTITSVVRQVFSEAPPGEREGVLALGGTRWGMIRTVVLPFGRSGIIGGTMLGLGRALGETIAVVILILYSPNFTFHILQQGTSTIASLIAEDWSESNPIALSALMAAGVLLFLVTLVVNSAASIIVSRSRSGAATEI